MSLSNHMPSSALEKRNEKEAKRMRMYLNIVNREKMKVELEKMGEHSTEFYNCDAGTAELDVFVSVAAHAGNGIQILPDHGA